MEKSKLIQFIEAAETGVIQVGAYQYKIEGAELMYRVNDRFDWCYAGIGFGEFIGAVAREAKLVTVPGR